jgi:hypothetical protein
MSAIDEFFALLETTEVVQYMIRSMREEPAQLLGDICREFERTGRPVPDHHLHIGGYMGEAAIKVLVLAGLVQREPGGIVSTYSYRPTDAGRKHWESLKADGFLKK